ncbi:SDR family NAD(P)-dependent oxidoreductase [Vibrio sp. 99-70-13A1]|uniref:SDR family NAD(P)-dependent oxidoreductase n=1 Tax=Vibrio sp. 99-70-13A1 TaxID=2607601 RepID=UPI001493CBEE|nr:SDR family NAD(P)-dependent oxidoreductase [Vibrio sp. 99-70-13A1]NOH97631.1 SDR family NAD(P)-dependent oxidoreductase [Vibrio sp. 99-70-13A1]
MKILIIGGSGGIGHALIKQLLARKPDASIYATYNSSDPRIDHGNVQWFKVDASSEQDVLWLSNQLSDLDLLINAIGSLHTENKKPEKSVSEFCPDFFHHNLDSNVVPTILLSKYFAKHLKSKHTTFFVSLSARVGSIEDNNIGGWISYRCSKAALNMAIKTISIEWKYKSPHCCVLSFHPGTTDTELSKPFQKNVKPEKLFTSQYVACQLLDLLKYKDASDTGKFFSFNGEEIPW